VYSIVTRSEKIGLVAHRHDAERLSKTPKLDAHLIGHA
jgi:hypothetical protein